MGANRRDFLKIAGLGAISLGTAKTAEAGLFPYSNWPKMPWSDDPVKKSDSALQATHWALVIDTTKRQGEGAWADAIQACNEAHNIPQVGNVKEEIKWIWAEPFHYAMPDQEYAHLPAEVEAKTFPVLCNHCENPPCVRVCPTKATFKRASDGIVMMDYHRCIGCRFCMAACPYGSRSFNWRDPRRYLDMEHINREYPTRAKGVVEKCNFCAERLAKGLKPACVEACKDGALAFGDLDDPNSDVRKLLKTKYTIRRKPSLGTGPSVYYII